MTKELQNLIKNLNKNEQGYFKKSLKIYSTNKTSNSEKLFNSIKSKRKIPAKQSYQLYWQVADIMYNYHSAQSEEREIHAALVLTNVLISKADVLNAKKLLQNALTIAMENEWYHYVLKIVELFRFRVFDLYDIKEIPNKLTEWDNQAQMAGKKMIEENYFLNDYIRTYMLVRTKNVARNDDEIKTYTSIINHEYYTAVDDETLTLYALLLKYNVLCTVYYMTGNTKTAYEKSKYLLEKLSAKKLKADNIIKLLIETLNNHYIICIEQNKQNELEYIIETINRLKNNKQIKNKLSVLQRLNELNLLYNLSAIETKNNKPEIIINKLQHLEENYFGISVSMPLNKQNMFRFLFAEIYLKINQYKRAYTFLRNIINSKMASIGISTASHFLELIILFETKDYLYLEQKIRNLYRFLRKNQRLMLFEQNVLKLLSDILSGKIKTEKEFFIKFKSVLDEVKNNPKEINTLKYFDYEKWVDKNLV